MNPRLVNRASCSATAPGPRQRVGRARPGHLGRARPARRRRTTSSRAAGHLMVFAAASLKKTFTEIGAEFEKSHPGATVSFDFAGSSDLVSQLQQGAPADVFASADTANMTKATGDSLTAAAPVTSRPTPSRSPSRPATRPTSPALPT